MTLMSQIENIQNKISSKILYNASLSNFSWFNLGGPAKILFRPKNLQELSIFLKEIKGVNEIRVLGVGSNTLVRDGGFDGIIIKLGKNFSHISLFNQNTIIAGSAALDRRVSEFALENSISGFELDSKD